MPNQFGQLQDRGTTKALQVRFSLSPSYTLSLTPEVGAVIPLDMPELLFHQGWRRWSVGFTAPAVAANGGECQLRNPVGSSTIMVLERLALTGGNVAVEGTHFVTSSSAADLANVLSGGYTNRDTRMAPNNKPVGIVSWNNTVAGGPGINGSDFFIQPSNTFDLPGAPWILTPDSSLTAGLKTLNNILTFTFVWRERPLQEQENTP